MTMKEAKKRGIWEQYLKSIAPYSGIFQHFDSEEKKQQHLKQVVEVQQQGSKF
jgi:hypothetical protein